MSHWQTQNYYEILEITPAAHEHEIHEAYQRAKATYSVDSPALYTMFTPQEAQALNRLIEEAYSVLGNQRLRLAYDSKLTTVDSATTNTSTTSSSPLTTLSTKTDAAKPSIKNATQLALSLIHI